MNIFVAGGTLGKFCECSLLAEKTMYFLEMQISNIIDSEDENKWKT